jgi:hypothetical protein
MRILGGAPTRRDGATSSFATRARGRWDVLRPHDSLD